MIRANALGALLLFGGLAAPASLAAQEAPWPMFGRSAQHEGRTAVVGPQSALVGWTVETGTTRSGAWSPVIGAADVLYVADEAGLTALSRAGVALWHYPGAQLSVPALGSDGTIYVGSPAGLVALEPDGTVAWVYSSGMTRGPVVALDGTVYAIGSGPAVYAVRPGGTLKWRRAITGIYGVPGLGPAGTVYVTGSRQFCTIEVCFTFSRLLALDPRNGQPRLLFVNVRPGDFTSPPVVDADGTIYVGTGLQALSSALYAIRPTGGRKWQHPIGGFVFAPPALGADGTVYVGAGDAFVYAIRSNGTLAWRYETEGAGAPGEGSLGMLSSPVVGGDGIVYAGSQDGFVYALNPDGTLEWRHEMTGEQGDKAVIQASPAIGSDGTLYISGWIGSPQPTTFLLRAFERAPGLAAP